MFAVFNFNKRLAVFSRYFVFCPILCTVTWPYICNSAVCSGCVRCVNFLLIIYTCLSNVQVMDNAKNMLENRYKNDRYKGHGIHVYKVPNNTQVTGYDVYPADQSEYERDFLSKPKVGPDTELVKEFRQLMEHHRSGLFRQEFSKCGDTKCGICAGRNQRRGEVDDVFDRFPAGMFPTPVPVLRHEGQYPILDTLMESHEDLAVSQSGEVDELSTRQQEIEDFAKANTGHYRNLFELVKTSLPDACFRPDSHYAGPSVAHRCRICDNFFVFKSQASMKRHMRLVHEMNLAND